MANILSNEFIQFQKKYSPLAQQLIDLFAEGNKLRDDTIGSITVKMTTVLKWFKTEGGIKLAKIISDYLGVKIDKIKVSKNIDFGFAIQMKIGDFICIILQIIRLINPMHIHEIRPITHGMFNWLFSKYDKMPRENLPLDTPMFGLKN